MTGFLTRDRTPSISAATGAQRSSQELGDTGPCDLKIARRSARYRATAAGSPMLAAARGQLGHSPYAVHSRFDFWPGRGLSNGSKQKKPGVAAPLSCANVRVRGSITPSV